MTDARQRQIYDAIWRWREPKDSAASHAAGARRRSLVQGCVMLVVSALLFRFGKHRVPPVVLLVMALFVLVSGQFAPRLFVGFERFGKLLGRAVGTFTTWLLLVPFFALCFVPARLILLLARRDPMRRQFPGAPGSFWVDHAVPKDLEQYGKQY